ncbi:hypothetical protein [Fusobacterium varium]|uniref:hypothetical protein n=1 Tax=Fusobacterium varium TaxID=856 RepID=UPI003566445F
MNSNIKLFFKIITTTGTFLLAYHKYILSLFDKKLDKRDCEKERLYAEKFRIENIKILTDGIRGENDKNKKTIDETIQELIY